MLEPSEVEDIVAELQAHRSDTLSIEVKAALYKVPGNLYDTLSSFSNGPGGIILLGINEEKGFAIEGVLHPGEMAQTVASMCSEMKPAIDAEIDAVTVQGKDVVVAIVPALPSRDKPCYRRSLGLSQGTYLRHFDGDVHATDEDIRGMLADQTPGQEDRRAVQDATIGDLDDALVGGLLKRMASRRGFQGVDRNTALLRLGAVVIHEGDVVPTVAGLLVLGSHPQQFLPRIQLEYVEVPSEGRVRSGIRLEKSEKFMGPIPHMVADALNYLRDALKGAIKFEGGQRTDEGTYPEVAVREAIVNALVHRELGGEGVEASSITLHPDALVISNPGGLIGVHADELTADSRKAPSVARNPTLLQLLEDTPGPDGQPVCESRGTGIPAMVRSLRLAGLAPPRFVDEVTRFSVDFPKYGLLDPDTQSWLHMLAGGSSLRGDLQLGLALMRHERRITNASYCAATGVADSRLATKDLSELVDIGLVEMHGSRRWAYYTLNAAAEKIANGEGGSFGAPASIQQLGMIEERRERVFQAIGSRPGINAKDLKAVFPDVAERTLERDLAALAQNGRIEFKLPRRTGGYQVVAGRKRKGSSVTRRE
jgi:ATP-dependent DNA helicase RecG